MSATTLADTKPRAVAGWGGLTPTFLAIEARRMLRNRRMVIFSFIMPAGFYLLFGKGRQDAGDAEAARYALVSLALYAAMLTSTAAGASVSVERAQGWSRQLRLTPLRPWAFVLGKVVLAALLGFAAVAVEFAVGAATGSRMPAIDWVECGLAAWAGSLVFAAFGVFMGYLLPSENVMQILGPVLALLAFAGGLFLPLDLYSPTVRHLAQLTPVYGLGELVRSPLVGHVIGLGAVVSIVVWSAVFVAGAAWRFRRDTARA